MEFSKKIKYRKLRYVRCLWQGKKCNPKILIKSSFFPPVTFLLPLCIMRILSPLSPFSFTLDSFPLTTVYWFSYSSGVTRRFAYSSDGGVCLQCGTTGFDPWVRKIPWRRKWQPTPVFLSGKSHERRSLAGYGPWGCKESDTTEQLTPI